MPRRAGRLAVLAASIALFAAISAADAQAGFRFFHSPSGNIGCAIGGGQARCDIKQHSWSAPPKPSNCPLDWGYGLIVSRSGSGHFFCGGDTVFGAGGVLPYGSSASQGDFFCRMRESGVECLNRSSEHGFVLSRESTRRF
jgi:hypothetical protein